MDVSLDVCTFPILEESTFEIRPRVCVIMRVHARYLVYGMWSF